MIDQSFLESLPNDTGEAFVIFESEMRKKIPDQKDFNYPDEQRQYDAERYRKTKEYILAVSAFLDLYEIDINVNFDDLLEKRGEAFNNAFEEASTKVIYYSNKCALKQSLKIKQGTSCIYVLEEASKLKIHNSIGKIRKIITNADLTDDKKDALFSKLNAFALEVDRDRTRLEALAAIYVNVKAEASDIADLSDNIEKIWNAIASGGKELWKALPNPSVKGRLPAPQKKLEDKSNFDLDDEIPF